MKILLLGKRGQIGKEIVNNFEGISNFFSYDSDQLNFLDTNKVLKTIDDVKPEIIINAAAFTDVNGAENNKDEAFKLNAEIVGEIAVSAKKNNARLIHFSTDYVFNGKKSLPYNEDDTTEPLSIYGLSKLNGENLILKSGCNFVIIRTSWVISKYENNFLTKIVDQILTKDIIKVVNDQFGAVTSANFIAKIITKIIYTNIKSGIYHLASSGTASWYDIAIYILNELRDDRDFINQKNVKIYPISSNLQKNHAIRPKNSSLDCSKLEKILKYKFPHWKIEIKKIIKSLL